MAKFQVPLLGYNNNVRHRGRVFHIQTEDSGVNHPHVITHLFMDGGRILKSVKKSYAEHVGSDGLKETVRVLMKEQHKAMFIALRDGQFDELVDGGAPKKGSDPKAAKVVPPPPASATNATNATDATVAEAAAAPSPPVSQIEISVERAASLPEEQAPNTVDERRHPAPPAEPFALDASGPTTIPEPTTGPAPAVAPERRPSAAELTLDFDALERDAGVGVSPQFQASDLPPPPKNLFAKERGTGTYTTVEVERHHDDTRAPARPSNRPSATPPRSAGRGQPAPPQARKSLPPSRREDRREDAGRYAPARPANIFGSTLKPQAPASSLFGDELVSDKSLDEVILSYLAEDLDPKR